MVQYFWNLLIALDQSVNAVCGGDPDETISSRLGKWARDGRNKHGNKRIIFNITNWIVELFQKDHFAKSIEEDEGTNEVLK